MKKLVWVTILLISCWSQAQDFHAWIYFTDKPNAVSALANPSTILTQKALDRKARHNVAIDIRDVPLNQAYVNQVKNEPGISYKAQSKWFNCVHVVGSVIDIDALATLAFVDRIEYADPTKSLSNSQVSKWSQESYSVINYGSATNQIEMLDLDELHDLGFTGGGITIAVTDSGFPNVDTNPGFNRLRMANGIVGGYDFVDRNGIFYDDHFHGSRVLSVMAGSESGNFEGASPDAFYYLFRTEEAAQETPAELSYWVAAAERADSLGVDVINVSLGYLNFDNPAENLTYQDLNGTTAFISRGANVAFEKGMAVVVSAGNSGNSSTHPFISAPADAMGTLSVGAVDPSMNRSVFSSIGPTVDNRIAPDVAAQGTATATINESGVVVGSNGTSFSAPLMSGAVACLIHAFPNLPPAVIYEKIREGSSQFNSPDNLLGYGIPNFGAIYQTLSINNNEVSLKFYVDRDVLVFALSEKIQRIQLFNLQGQLVLEQKSSAEIANIDLTHLQNGIYIFRVNEKQKAYKIAF
jgi:subtilisin family serine protease